MKLIVGLGNPGKEYENTRHNIGFMVLDELADLFKEEFSKEKFRGLYFTKIINNDKVIFLKPQKYMNLSGEVVRDFVSYFNISKEDILAICDDLDLPVGKVRLRKKGSSGGHNGLKNIELHLNTNEFKRLKVGISNNKLIDTKNYVLGNFTKEENNILKEKIKQATNISIDFLNLNFEQLMSKYN